MSAAQRAMEEYEEEIKVFRKFDEELVAQQTKTQKLVTQKNENELVKQELDLLKGESKVFKLVGPVMVPHSKNEALEHVTKRLDFIETEIRRTEATMKDIMQKQKEQQMKVLKLQQKIQESRVPK